VPLRPLEVHAQEHLRPVSRLRAARAGADRDDRVLRVVLAREQQERALPFELPPEGGGLALEVCLRLRIGRVGEQVQQLGEVVCPLLERAPQRDLLAETLRLPGDLLCRALVLPEARLDGAGVELLDARFLGG